MNFKLNFILIFLLIIPFNFFSWSKSENLPENKNYVKKLPFNKEISKKQKLVNNSASINLSIDESNEQYEQYVAVKANVNFNKECSQWKYIWILTSSIKSIAGENLKGIYQPTDNHTSFIIKIDSKSINKKNPKNFVLFSLKCKQKEIAPIIKKINLSSQFVSSEIQTNSQKSFSQKKDKLSTPQREKRTLPKPSKIFY